MFKSYKPEYKDGEQVRDFVYIKDVVDLMFEFYKNPQIKGIYNVGTGQSRTWNDLAKAIFSALNLEPEIEYIPMPEQIRDKYQYSTKADLKKLDKTATLSPSKTLMIWPRSILFNSSSLWILGSPDLFNLM